MTIYVHGEQQHTSESASRKTPRDGSIGFCGAHLLGYIMSHGFEENN